MTYQNAINWTNVTSWTDYLQVPNTTTGGWFWAVMLWMIFSIITLVMSGYGFETALMIASFICLFLGVLLATGGLIAWWVVGTFVGVILFVVLYMEFSKRP